MDEEKKRSKLWLVPFVAEGVGAPLHVEGETNMREARTIVERGEGVYLSASNAGEAHRRARAVLELRSASSAGPSVSASSGSGSGGAGTGGTGGAVSGCYVNACVENP